MVPAGPFTSVFSEYERTREWGRVLEELKQFNDLSGDEYGLIMKASGNTFLNSELFGNVESFMR